MLQNNIGPTKTTPKPTRTSKKNSLMRRAACPETAVSLHLLKHHEPKEKDYKTHTKFKKPVSLACQRRTPKFYFFKKKCLPPKNTQALWKPQ
jgi:hypothetical protein